MPSSQLTSRFPQEEGHLLGDFGKLWQCLGLFEGLEGITGIWWGGDQECL